MMNNTKNEKNCQKNFIKPKKTQTLSNQITSTNSKSKKLKIHSIQI